MLSAPYAADSRIDPSIFINPSTLHLTVVMLKLYTDEARAQAQQLMKELQPAIEVSKAVHLNMTPAAAP